MSELINNEKTRKITVVIAVYSAEMFIQKSILSLKKQNIEFQTIEIILINDGSTDNSGDICKKLAQRYSNIIYIEQNNQGVSAARNAGLKKASGKYIFFLDADDTLEHHTVKNVSDFFDSVYEEVDLVTYPITTFFKGKKLAPHFRYQYLKENGIYDLRKYPYIGQTTMNIVVKNKFKNNVLFDEDQTFSEDQKYCCEILKNKLKIGFCKDGEYIYNRNSNSSSGRLSGACYIFEQCMKFFEELFEQYDEVPAAFQGLYVNDIYWKMCSNILFPYHYEGTEYQEAVARIKNLLQKCDNDVILEHPQMDFFEKYYLLHMKGKDSLKCDLSRSAFALKSKGKTVVSEQNMEVVITKFKIENEQLEILGFIKSVFLQFWNNEVIFCAIENDGKITKKLTLFDSAHNYYLSHEKTQKFQAFRYRVSLKTLKKVRFEVGFQSIWFPTHFYFMPQIPFSHKYKRHQIEYCGFEIRLTTENEFCFLQQEEAKTQRIWLYYDCAGVSKDNGYFQFIHDIQKKDGIDRYYIVTDKKQKIIKQYKKHFILFGTRKHKKLLEKSQKVLTAYIEESNIFPYTRIDMERLADRFQFEVVYLQHGVLHIKMPWKFSPEKILADKIVVSTEEEKQLLIKNGFKESELYPTGMARFELLDRSKQKKKKILFAPSWRSYLVGGYVGHRWEQLEEKFKQSKYFEEIQKFVQSPRLEEILRKYEYTLEIKFHPIFSDYLTVLQNYNPRITKAGENIIEEEYEVFITDFSSFMYDFLYLDTYIINFIPDILEFKSGMNGYRDLNYKEDFWENTAYTSDALIKQIEEYFLGQKKKVSYAHFFNFSDCREELYKKLYEK